MVEPLSQGIPILLHVVDRLLRVRGPHDVGYGGHNLSWMLGHPLPTLLVLIIHLAHLHVPLQRVHHILLHGQKPMFHLSLRLSLADELHDLILR